MIVTVKKPNINMISMGIYFTKKNYKVLNIGMNMIRIIMLFITKIIIIPNEDKSLPKTNTGMNIFIIRTKMSRYNICFFQQIE